VCGEKEKKKKNGKRKIKIKNLTKGLTLNAPNDVTVRKDGVIFFTDPYLYLSRDDAPKTSNGLYSIINGVVT